MRNTLAAFLLMTAAALAQDQPSTSTPTQGNPPQEQQQTQQQVTPASPATTEAPSVTQPPAAQQPETQAPPAQAPAAQAAPVPQQAPTPEPAPENLAKPTQAQPSIAKTNKVELFRGPTLSDVYCSGFITKQDVHASAIVIDDARAPEQVRSAERSYIYLSGRGVEEGREYLLLRHTHDPNHNQSFPGQLGLLSSLGELYEDLGRAKVIAVRKKVGVALVEQGCSEVLPGDMAVPFQERPRPEYKQTNFEQFAVPTGKTKGRVVLAQDLGTLVGNHRIIYLNVGEAQGVKPGDYFRALRDYGSIANNPAESLPFKAPPYDPTQKNPPNFEFRGHAGELPIRAIGEMIVLNTTPNTSTALTTYTPEEIHLGDTIEMIDSTPLPPPAVEATAAALPPTINCSVSRSTIQVGESSIITCNGVAEEGHTLTYSYQASAGQITPRENRATLTPNAPGPITVTATAVDDRNLSAQSTVNLDVQSAPLSPTSTESTGSLTPSMLNELTFKLGSARVDNRAKAELDDDALRLQRDANATLIIEGSANPSENEALALQRAENAKTYLTQSKGIDASRIQTRAAQTKTGAKVVVVMVPAGAPPQQ
ncbi:MAG: hypothetical protein DMG63_17685 [Acidobacteria bacterium]|nr:MAG: hypothetical protein DMG63_17685 [Acidobacteriota bacterium]